jgi:hypothetical protein
MCYEMNASTRLVRRFRWRSLRWLPPRFACRAASTDQRIDAVAFCCNVHRGVVGGAEAGAGVTNYWLCDADLVVDVAARDGTISLLLTSENSSASLDAPILRTVSKVALLDTMQ